MEYSMATDKTTTLLKFVKVIRDVLNNDPLYFQDTKDVDYSYTIKIIDEIGSEVSKFTLGVKHGKMEINPTYSPDVLIMLTESAFFGLLRGKTTLEEAYFSNEADIWSKDGKPYCHALGMKRTFNKMEKVVREKLGDV